MNRGNPVPARSLSFITALAQFRDECRQIGELDDSDLAHFDRWARDHRAEAVWRKVKLLAFGPIGSYDPLEGFIPSILVARRMAESIPTFLRLHDRQKRRNAHFDRLANQAADLARTWSDVAGSSHKYAPLAAKRAKFYEEDSRVLQAMANRSPRQLPFLVSRVDRNGSQKQRAFMQLVGKYMINVCGRPLDTEVAILSDIAFDSKEATQPYQARSARRQTTRAARASSSKRSA
jgi:hypothetical protein